MTSIVGHFVSLNSVGTDLQLLLLGKHEYPILPSFSVLSADLRKKLGGLGKFTCKIFREALIATEMCPCLH